MWYILLRVTVIFIVQDRFYKEKHSGNTYCIYPMHIEGKFDKRAIFNILKQCLLEILI